MRQLRLGHPTMAVYTLKRLDNPDASVDQDLALWDRVSLQPVPPFQEISF